MNLQIVPLRPEHCSIVPHLRQQDVLEIHAMGELSPSLAVACSVACSERGFTALLDDSPAAVFGVHYGVIWLVGTDDITRHPITFYRQSRKIFHELKKGYRVLHNFVHVSNTFSLRWLQWLGFQIDPPKNNFHYVHYTNKEEE